MKIKEKTADNISYMTYSAEEKPSTSYSPVRYQILGDPATGWFGGMGWAY